MKLTPLLLLVYFFTVTGCRDAELVVTNRLAPGGGDGGGGGMGTTSQPQLDIVVRLENDATDFNPGDLMRVVVNGADRTDAVVIGGHYAILRIDPAPVGTPQFVELYRRTGPVLDTFTYNPMPYTGPTLSGVLPDTARIGTQVTIMGTGFSGGALRVYFGGVEGTVDASSDTSITATVPAGAFPGLVYVLVGDAAAAGVVGFQPTDTADQPLAFPTGIALFAVFPGNGVVETPLMIYGLNFSNLAAPDVNDTRESRVFDVQTITVPPIGDVVRAFGVIAPATGPGAGAAKLVENGIESAELPFTVN